MKANIHSLINSRVANLKVVWRMLSKFKLDSLPKIKVNAWKFRQPVEKSVQDLLCYLNFVHVY